MSAVTVRWPRELVRHAESTTRRAQVAVGDSSLGAWLTMCRRHRRSRTVLTGQADKTQRLVEKKNTSCKLLSWSWVLLAGQWVSMLCLCDCPLFGVVIQLMSDEDEVLRNEVVKINWRIVVTLKREAAPSVLSAEWGISGLRGGS